jgi:CheY-like chemotaxis protein
MQNQEARCRILLIEDNSGDALLTQRAINKLSPPLPIVTHVTTMEQALVALSQGTFSIILTDLDLPDSSGRETYQRLLLAAGDIPIIILWGSQDEITLQEALAMGVRDYLEKGAFTSSDLSRVLRLARG